MDLAINKGKISRFNRSSEYKFFSKSIIRMRTINRMLRSMFSCEFASYLQTGKMSGCITTDSATPALGTREVGKLDK